MRQKVSNHIAIDTDNPTTLPSIPIVIKVSIVPRTMSMGIKRIAEIKTTTSIKKIRTMTKCALYGEGGETGFFGSRST